jgi:hypothetical protein
VPRPAPRTEVRIALLALTGLVAVTLHRAVFLGEVFFERDIHQVWLPQVESWVRAVAAASWPVWDRSIAFGQPLWADPSAQILYPPSWLNLLLAPWVYYTLFVCSHLVFSGLGTFLLGRSLGLSARGALSAGAVWMLSGPFFSLANVYHHFASAAWLPWVLLAAQRTAEAPSRRRAGLWGVVLAAQLLGGSADMCLLAGLLSLLVLGRHLRWRRPGAPENRRLVLAGLGALALGLGLSAAQWLPTLEVALRSARWSLPDRMHSFWSLQPAALLQALWPVPIHDLPLRPDVRAFLYEGREPFLLSIYLGLASAVLVVAAFAGARARLALGLAAVAAVAVLIAFGPHTPVHGLAEALLPPLRMLRFPQKALVATALCWALLAGLGHDAWAEAAWPRRRLVLLAALPALLAGAALYGGLRPVPWLRPLLASELDARQLATLAQPLQGRLLVAAALTLASLLVAWKGSRRWPRPVAALLAVSAAADLALAHHDLHRTGSKDLFTYRPPLVGLLSSDDHRRVYVHEYDLLKGKSQRLFGRDQAFTLGRRVKGWSGAETSALADRAYLLPPIGGIFGLEYSYDLDSRGLYPTPLSQIVQLARALEGTPAHVFLLRLGAVRSVTALHRVEPAELQEVAREPGYFADPIRVFRVPDPLPRAFAVSGVRVVDGASALELLRDAAFDPTTEVLLPAGEPRPPIPGFFGDVSIERLKPDRVELRVRLNHDGLVVLVDAFDPGWQARVDGDRVQPQRADFAFTAVPVPKGAHRVVLIYRPRGLWLGLATSATAALLALVLVARRRPARWSSPAARVKGEP